MESGGTATIVHTIPGRIRVRLDRISRSPAYMASLAEKLSQVEGVQSVEGNPSTGSLLLLYDPDVLNVEQLYLAARASNLNVLIPGTEPQPPATPGPSPVAARINSAFGQMDRAVQSVSGGVFDAKTLVPLGLAAAALRQIVATAPNLSTVPWYVLAWYSFELFTKYNLRRGGGY